MDLEWALETNSFPLPQILCIVSDSEGKNA